MTTHVDRCALGSGPDIWRTEGSAREEMLGSRLVVGIESTSAAEIQEAQPLLSKASIAGA